MKLTLGFSPCPNDTFVFDALVHHKINTDGLEWKRPKWRGIGSKYFYFSSANY